jgi:Methyltransferase domain
MPNVLASYTNDLPGWMSPEELSWLYKRASEAASVAEIGCWRGRSTHALLSGCQGPVYAVDTWKQCGVSPVGYPPAEDEEVFADFNNNVGSFPNLRIVRMPSVDAARIVGMVDMVFIDADHSYESVIADIRAWEPKTLYLVSGHDFDMPEYPGVTQAVCESFHEVERCGSIWFVRKSVH